MCPSRLFPGALFRLTLAVIHTSGMGGDARKMARKPPGSVFKRCGCRRGRAGLRLGASCPRLAEDDHGSWFFSLELPRHVGGTRRRIRRGGYTSREEAERALGRLQVTGGRVLTVADWLEIWLATRTRVRDKTLRGYTAHVRLHLVPHLGQVLLAELDVAYLDRAFTALLRQDGVTVATAHRVLATLRSALNTAVREKLIGDSPARYLQLPPARRPHAVVWTPRRVKEWKRTGVRPAVAVDPGADRAVPGLHQRPLAVRRLPPDRAKGTSPRRGRRAALVRHRPGPQDRLHQLADPVHR
jgi:hypothetical protein